MTRTAPATDQPDALLEAAAIWHARLREPTGGAAMQREFAAWLDADPRHAPALEEAGRLWDLLERPAARALEAERAETAGRPRDAASATARAIVTFRRRGPSGMVPPRRALAIAACLLIMIGAGAFWRDDIVVRVESDYATAVGERAPVTLADGSRVTLNTDSAIAVDFGPARRHVRLLRGEAWFDVAHDAAWPFVVETPEGAVRVTGTSFDVRRDDGSTVVSLTEGRVELTIPAGPRRQPVALEPGEQSRLSASGISAPAPFDRTAATAWLRGQFVFYDTPLAQVVATLNRYRRGRIVIADNDLSGLKVSGVFATGDPNAALAVIADTLPVRVTRLTDYLVLLH